MFTYKRQTRGWFKQFGIKHEFSMELSQNANQIRGQIEDTYGKATFEGTFMDQNFIFLKSYYSGRSQGIQFKYAGIYNSENQGISGIWHSPDYPDNSGAFGIYYK